MSARSVNVTFKNQTNCCLVLASDSLQHGDWNGTPPAYVPVQGTASWENDESGVMTGAQGSVTYGVVQVQGGNPVFTGNVVISWNNPFVGSNSYTLSAPPGLEVGYTDGSGNNASVTVNLTLKAGSDGMAHTTTLVSK